MTLDDFTDKWKELQDVSRSVAAMSNTRDNSLFFGEAYEQFRDQLDEPFTSHPFSEHDNFDGATINFLLLHAANYRLGLEKHSLNFARDNLSDALDGVREKLGDDNLVDYMARLDVRVDNPEGFVRRLRSYKEAIKPLDRENPQPGLIKRKLVQEIDDVIGQNPDEKTRLIGEALKAIYDSDRAAASAYAHVFVKPERDAVKELIERYDSWKTYMGDNLDEHAKEEQVEFYTDMYGRFRNADGTSDED